MPNHPLLFNPLAIGRYTLPNRVVMPAMGSNLADSEGRVTPAMIAYYAARAAGRPGMLVVEAACVHPTGRVIARHLMNHGEAMLPGLKELARAIKDQGVITILQIIHGGRNAHAGLVPEFIAPSAIKGPTSRSTPRAMTTLEIEALVHCFADAAARAVEAGFDGVEVHAAHEYLIHQFLTPYCNRRQDSYGGDLMGRTRFAREVLRAVRRAIGPDHILSMRFSGEDHVRGGMNATEAAVVAQLLEEHGVDLFSVTGGVYETPHMVVPPLPMPPGTHLAAAAAIRQRVKAPVAGVGRLRTAAQVEEALKQVDLACVGRAFLADPQWLNKAAQGRQDHARPCLGCNQGCIDRVLAGVPITCVANPWLGLEGELAELAPVDNGGLKAVVVGGGLAGCEAARTLGSLGHRVVLFESECRLGGQTLLAAAPPGKAEFAGLVEYYERALAELPEVEIRLKTPATVAKVCACAPQAVIMATGSRPLMPALPGLDEASVVTARQVLAGQVRVGKSVAVLGGGNLGSEVAHYLAARGHEVVIIELGLNIGADLGPARRYILRRDLSENKVRRHTHSLVRRLYRDRVGFLRLEDDGTRQPVDLGPVDTFVAALGAAPVEDLYLALEPKVQSLYLIGDARSPARMGEATSEGVRTALLIHRDFLANSLSQAAVC